MITVNQPRENGRTTFCRQFTYNPQGEYNSRRDGAIVSGAPVDTPPMFGDGSDGDLIIRSGEVVELDVPEPHISIIEKRYSSILIENGGILKCKSCNAGLVLRCSGDCTIHGTIDQSGKAPKTNPNNTYIYPSELVCGAGGSGGNSYTGSAGGSGMAGRPYGGGYGAGGGGGKGAVGGSAIDITIGVPDSSLFRGGAGETEDISSREQPGTYGGGGGGGGQGRKNGDFARGGNGGTGAGSKGGNGGYYSSERYSGGGGGGAGNIGGGIVMLYAGGDLSMDGCTINCNGGNGGAGGENSYVRASGGGGGGGGGGAIYFVHFNPMSESDLLGLNFNVNGGSGGGSKYGASGAAGGLGSVTIKQYEKGMTV